jgi:hypothetical protein
MKKILLLSIFVLSAVAAFAQYPAAPNKIALGRQTTGNGLVYITDSIPFWTPTTANNAWAAIDTLAKRLYAWRNGQWESVVSAGGTTIDSLTYASDTLYLYTSDGTFTTEIISSGGGVQYSDSLTVFVTPSQLSDSLAAQPQGTVTSVATGIGLTGGPITSTGTISADTATVLASKTWVNTRGFPTGVGTVNAIPVWSTTTALGDSPLTVSGTDVTATGTGAFRLPNGTTAQQPTPAAGMTRYNTTNGALEYYGAAAWEVPVKSATATGLGTAGQILFPDANGRATGDAGLFYNNTTKHFGIGSSSPATRLFVRQGGTGNNVVTNLVTIENEQTSAADFGGTGILFREMVRTTGSVSVLSDAALINTSKRTSGASTAMRMLFQLKQVAAGNTLVVPLTLSSGSSSTVQNPSAGINIGDEFPSRTLDVNGEARIRDLVTTTPTLAVGADADGVLSAITIGSGLSLTSGTLTAVAGGNGDVLYTDSLTVFVTPTQLSDSVAAVPTLYRADGTLVGDRTVTLNDKFFWLKGEGGVNYYMDSTTLAMYKNSNSLSITATQTELAALNANSDLALLAEDTIKLTSDFLQINNGGTYYTGTPPRENTHNQIFVRDSLTGQIKIMDKASIAGGGGATDLSFSGSASPVTLNSSTGTDVRFVAGTGVTLASAGDSLVINATAVQPPAVENIETTTFTALAGIINQVDCSGGAVTVNPPASPVIGMRFAVVDATASAATNNITIDFDSAGQDLYGGAEPTYILNVPGAYVEFIYMGATTGWIGTKG